MSLRTNFVLSSIALGVITIILNLVFLVAVLGVIGLAAWFFLVEAGMVPPMDYVPIIPNV